MRPKADLLERTGPWPSARLGTRLMWSRDYKLQIEGARGWGVVLIIVSPGADWTNIIVNDESVSSSRLHKQPLAVTDSRSVYIRVELTGWQWSEASYTQFPTTVSLSAQSATYCQRSLSYHNYLQRWMGNSGRGYWTKNYLMRL